MKGSWVVAVRDADGKVRAEVVADRGTVRLTRFVETYVRIGSWLWSDYWRGYANGTSNTQDIFGAMGIRGLSVNHDVTFKEWHPEHRKFAITNSIEGDWNAFIAKTPKRMYGFKTITPYLRQVEWDREATNLWTDWWKALRTCTPQKAANFLKDLNDLHATDPNQPKPSHPLLRTYPRGFHTITGNNVGKQSSKSRPHYAYCSTSNPNHYGCLKCDFYWGQFCVGDVDLIKEARKVAYLDEKDKARKKKNNKKKNSVSQPSQDVDVDVSEEDTSTKTKKKKNVVSRLSLVIKALEEAYEAAAEARRLAVAAKMAAQKVGAVVEEDSDEDGEGEDGDDDEDDEEDDLFGEEEEGEEGKGKKVASDEDDD